MHRAGAPAARLSAQRFPDRHAVRRARLTGIDGALVVADPDGRERRLPVGPTGVTRAVHVTGPELAAMHPPSLGAVDLHMANGTRAYRLLVDRWVPEADELTDPGEALRRSELREVLGMAGLQLGTIRGSAARDALGDGTAAPLVSMPALPLWFTVLRSLAVVFVVGVLMTVVLTDSGGRALTAAAGALLVSTLASSVLWLRALRRDRVPPATGPALRPRPAGQATRRFVRTAELRAEPDDVVVIDGIGTERWLPRRGPLGVRQLAVVRAGTATAAVEVRAADGTPRATLPYAPWFGGDGGAEALEELARAGGLELVPDARGTRRVGPEYEAARRAFAPRRRKEVSALLTYPPGVPGAAAFQQTGIFAAILLIGGEDVLGRALAAASLALSGGVMLGRGALRALWLDRPRTYG